MRLLYGIVCGIALAVGALAYGLEAKAQNAHEPKEWAESFLEALVDRGEDDAMDMIRKETPIGESYPGTLGSLSDQLRAFKMQAGSVTSYEFVGQKSLGSRLIRLTYVLNSTRLPLLWSFDMYNSSSGWQLIGLQFTTDSRSMPFE